jgi:hypothetical protein
MLKAISTSLSGGGGGVTSITGTANQVIASAATGDVTLSTPQDIATTSSPQFGKLTLTGGTIGGASATDNFLNITETMPATLSASTYATYLKVTGAGSSTQQNYALRIEFAAGYTGSSQCRAVDLVNNNAGTGANYASGNASGCYRLSNANGGLNSITQSSTVGINFGQQGLAIGSSVANYGGWFSATSSQNTPAIQTGVVGTALNGTTNVGGYFALTASGTPSLVSAAILGDCGATTSDILNLRDNGTTKVRVTDGGNTVTAEAARATTATDGFLYIPTCDGTPTGVPTAYTGTVPIMFDTSTDKIYIYNGGWKATAALT